MNGDGEWERGSGQPASAEQPPFWIPHHDEPSQAWDGPGWWRDEAADQYGSPDRAQRPDLAGTRQYETSGAVASPDAGRWRPSGRPHSGGAGASQGTDGGAGSGWSAHRGAAASRGSDAGAGSGRAWNSQAASARKAARWRSQARFTVFGGFGATAIVAVVGVLILTGAVSLAKAAPVPGFHPTTTEPAGAARQTAAVFLTAWEHGNIRKAASYTNHPVSAATALTSYRSQLHLAGLHLAVRSATRRRQVTFAVAATVALPGSRVSGTWAYTSQLTAYARDGGWWIRWNPVLVAPHLTTGETVMTLPVAPGSAEVADAAGSNLAGDGDPGLRNIAAALMTTAPAGGTPGIEVVLADSRGKPIGATADVIRHPVAVSVTRTTVNPAMESAALSAVRAHPDSSMVVLQPTTGHILAVANNDGANDFALTARVAPGSTDKIITATALLTTGLVKSPSQPVGCPKQLMVNGQTINNDKGESEPDSTPFLTDFAASCNNAFARWYSSIGASTLARTAQKYYGLNQVWNIGIGPGGPYYRIPATAYTGELAQELFGQGQLAASPVAMASIAATVDTGTFRQPVVVPGQKQLPATPLPGSVRQDLWQMMQAVTQPGGTAAGVFTGISSPVYGKTGTADVGGQQQPNSWMVVFDPSLNVAIGAVVLNAGYGASFAAPETATALRLITQAGG